MVMPYAKSVSTKETPQSEQIPGRVDQVKNNAGGFVFAVTPWTQLDRFLLLGSEGGTYYATERKLTVENVACVQECLAQDPKRTVARIVEVSEQGRAPKNSPAILALALAAAHKQASPHALAALSRVCRIGTDLFEFCEYVQNFRGWGRALRTAVGNWYLSKEPRDLAYQITKYQQRNGWSHNDVLRLSHPLAQAPRAVATNTPSGKPVYVQGPAENPYAVIFRWAKAGWNEVSDSTPPRELVPIWAFERAKRATTRQEIMRLIDECGLVRECIPTQWLNEPEVWEALLDHMPLKAMVRNLGKMTNVGLLKPLSQAAQKVVERLSDANYIKKSRLHPLAVLLALKTYQQGHGDKGKLTWTPVQQVCDALDGAFYRAFGNVEPTGKRWLFGLDISGSMWCGSLAGSGLVPAQASGALALVTAAVEPQHLFMGFTTQFEPVNIHPKMRLDDVDKEMRRLSSRMGGTDCSLPMRFAIENRLDVDAFVVITDNETWHGGIHPCQALKQYRDRMGIPAKLIVMGLTATKFTIADPADAGSLDVVGMDAATPQIMSDFVKG